MKLAMDSWLHAGDSMSEEHSGDSPDRTPESSAQSRSEKQSEHDNDMFAEIVPHSLSIAIDLTKKNNTVKNSPEFDRINRRNAHVRACNYVARERATDLVFVCESVSGRR